MAPTQENILEMLNRIYGDSIADPEVFPKIFTHQLKVAKMRVMQEPDPNTTDQHGQQNKQE